MVRVAVIGCGGIASVHLRSYAADSRARILAVADQVPQKAQAYAAIYGVKWYSDYRELLDREELDAVSVCTPPPSHQEIVETAARRGIHILCEKPLAMSTAEGTAMVKAADRAGVVLMTAFCHRFHPPVRQAKAWLEAGVLGQLHHMHFRRGGVELMEGTWFADPAQGGGLLWETAPHYVDLFRFLVGEVRDIYAKGATRAQPIAGEDTVAMLVESVDGVYGLLEGSWSSPHSDDRLTLHGERGAIVIDYNHECATLSTDGMRECLETGATRDDRFFRQASHFLDCVQGKAQPLVTGRDGVHALRLIEAARRSLKEGVPVAVHA